MKALKHPYPFDPSYGYSLEDLLAVGAPEAPVDHEAFWQARYEKALAIDPGLVMVAKGKVKAGWRVHEIVYQSTGGAKIGGWCLTPVEGAVERVMLVLHGYGGREGPDFHWQFEKTALLFPCARGIGRSPFPPVVANPLWHVLHDIQDRERYVHGGCVEDVWLGVSAARCLFPQAAGRVGLIGVSFGGGIGAMALAWDRRIARAHFNVPSFGNHPLRLTLETTGSGAAVRAMHRKHPAVVERTLSYHDAAVAAGRIGVPVHFLENLECPETLENMRRMDIVLVIGEEDPFRENNEHLCRILSGKNIGHRLHYWGERAHRGHYWRQMGPLFV